MKENTLYVERFRPTSLEHFVGNESIKDTIQKYHKRKMKVGSFTLYPLMPGEMPAEKKSYYSQEVKRLAELGVDWIETDQPELAWKDLHR